MDMRTILGTSMRRRMQLIEVLYCIKEGMSTESLLDYQKCSLPILLNDIKVVNQEQNVVIIEKYQGLYRLQLFENTSISQLYSVILGKSVEFQILEQLLYEKHENITDLANAMFISVSNTQRYLKKISHVLAVAGLSLKHRPLRIIGRESVVRHMFYRYFTEKHYELDITLPGLESYQRDVFERFATAYIEKNGYYHAYVFKHRIIYNMYISAWRIRNGHYFQEGELDSAFQPQKPDGGITDEFSIVLRENFGFPLTDEIFREVNWLQFTDSLMFGGGHFELAYASNERFKKHYQINREIVDAYNQMFSKPLPEAELAELAVVLQNSSFLYNEKGAHIEILRRTKESFVVTMRYTYEQSIEKIYQMLKKITRHYHFYEEKDFINGYIYWLVTAVPDSMGRMELSDRKLKILLISSLSPTEDKFLRTQLYHGIYGNFEIDLHASMEESVYELSKSYDLILSTGRVDRIAKNCQYIAIDSYLTWQTLHEIQHTISQLSTTNATK